MGNVIDYVNEFGEYSFLDRPFQTVDSLVLAVLSYLKYDDFLPSSGILKKRMSLKQIIGKKEKEKLFSGLLDIPSYRTLLLAVSNSRRFGRIELGYYVNQLDEKKESQFAALVFFLENEIPFVAFRGTDETLIGWKEDFNMAFLSPVPAQEKALRYLRRVARRLHGEFYVGGHSKGGNLAVFASVMIRADTQKKIRKIYSLEGPGFKEDTFEPDSFLRIADRTVKIIPKSSIIGMLLEHQENYLVINSTKSGLLQHDPFTWIVEKDDFQYLEDIDHGALIMNQALHEWIQGMEDEVRMKLVNTIFDILASTEIATVLEMTDGWKPLVKKIRAATKELDDETRRFLRKTIVQLLRMGTKSMIDAGEEESKNIGRKFE